ncbi:MerR family transcriptional regulator [Streptococcus suis]|uniref:MerR family transcriptional regulator n=1 Tax=Streptococcus suis TaxID=1307 RepID=UPI0014782B65
MVEIPRNERGIRQFDERSIDRLKAIVHYRCVGMPLEDIQKILAEFHNHALSSDLLKKTQAQIAALQETHAYLVKKIEIHQQLAQLEA